MNISPDAIVYYVWNGLEVINATIVFTWIVMLFLLTASWLITRKITSDSQISRWQNMLETVVVMINNQIREVSRQEPAQYLPFVGTIFLFIITANIMGVIPGFITPTGSLSTTVALALCVLIAVPVFGIAQRGPRAYLKSYLQPTVLMLPFNIIGEISRTLALSVRLYGNMMSGTVIIAILLSLVPLFFPVVMQLLGLITGVIQAYIFAILALVYITSASQTHQSEERMKGE